MGLYITASTLSTGIVYDNWLVFYLYKFSKKFRFGHVSADEILMKRMWGLIRLCRFQATWYRLKTNACDYCKLVLL